jgi:hypothetical protein
MSQNRQLPTRATGRCLCGAIRFEIEGPLRDVVVCHCGQCRRQHGSPPGYSQVAWEHIRLEGEVALAWYRSSEKARRGFCRICGSSLFWEPIGAGRVSIAAGSLDAPTGPRTVRHIFVADKGDYYEIHEDAEQLSGSMLTVKRA